MPALITEAHDSTRLALSSHNPGAIEDFGLIGHKVAALADLAQNYTNSAIDSSELNRLITEHFPWWNDSTLRYFPWMRWPFKVMKDPSTYLKMLRHKVGIVIPAGDGNARETAHLITTLRNVHKCKLPIDIAYVGDGDMSPSIRAFLSRLGTNVNFIDLTQVFDNTLIQLKGYSSKPFAILASRYPRTILLDSDAVFFANPDDIFSMYQSLKETGLLFFHDRTVENGNTPVRQEWVGAQLKLAGRLPSAHLANNSLFFRHHIDEEADAALVAVDKSKPDTYMAMVFACWMNTKHVRETVTYQRLFGDKDTYWLAAELTGVPYAFEPWSSARLAQEPLIDKGFPLVAPVENNLARGPAAQVLEGASKPVSQASPTIAAEVLSDEKEAKSIKLLATDTSSSYDKNQTTSRVEAPHSTNELNFPRSSHNREFHDSPKPITPNRRCTTHMVHPHPDGSEPLWANGGLWLDKRDRGLGLANWTHWYVGSRNDEALKTFCETSLPTDSPNSKSWLTSEDGEQWHNEVMNTQPRWYSNDWGMDAEGCPQFEEWRWQSLNQGFRDRLERMIEEVRKVEAAWVLELG
ncbi:hypothetical protein LTR84_004233 [Exophiala bonariae]|uniref:Uncharacterized protein n=1 Tax=Exophiala bonariae TaxID=1690606 RepID=A0AAV9N4C6_9EURO|nr:hypothetical protein LTR84_004233 [Exophiala bonariae]